MYFVVHVAGRVLRFVDCLPDGEAKCQLASRSISGARYELVDGPLPKSHQMEEKAAEFREKFLSKLADAFLDEHGYTDSGVYPKLRAV